tara:strand:- start:571 stop:855 length:285 start_codon:yes stop_codon:yes gene_type:complete
MSKFFLTFVRLLKELIEPIDQIHSAITKFAWENRFGRLLSISVMFVFMAAYSVQIILCFLFFAMLIALYKNIVKSAEVNAKADAKIDEVLNKEE